MGYVIEWESDDDTPLFHKHGHKRCKQLSRQKYKRVRKMKKLSKKQNRK